MNFFRTLLKKIFGNNSNQGELVFPPLDASIFTWKTKHDKKIKIIEDRLREWLIKDLQEKGTLSFSWQSGSDEAIVTLEGKDYNNAENFTSEVFFDLEEYIVDKLAIPDAGEFQMNGNGVIYIEDNLVKVKYSSIMKAIIDYNEETGEETYSEDEPDSGNKILFTI